MLESRDTGGISIPNRLLLMVGGRRRNEYLQFGPARQWAY